jgi:ferredoxin-NADP reductase
MLTETRHQAAVHQVLCTAQHSKVTGLAAASPAWLVHTLHPIRGVHRFGLPVGKHIFLYANVGGESIMRAYTPTSSDDDIGHFDLVVKIYRAGTSTMFPHVRVTGPMS